MLPALPLTVAKIFRLLVLSLFLISSLGHSAEAGDEMTQAVAQYELTLAHIKSYGALMAGLASWAEAQPAEARKFRARLKKATPGLAATIAQVEADPLLSAHLKQQQLQARDFVLLPVAVMQAQMAALGEAQGREFPADKINPKNTALVRKHGSPINEIMVQARADRARAFGP